MSAYEEYLRSPYLEVIGLGYSNNGKPGCGEDWDSVQIVSAYGNKKVMEEHIQLLKTIWYNHLAHLEWTIFGME